MGARVYTQEERRKFTDRDVRENPALSGLVYSYLSAYQGEFEPLVDAQIQMSRGPLTVPVVRKVLNCMRADERYVFPPLLPSVRQPERAQSNVVPIRPAQRKMMLDLPATLKAGYLHLPTGYVHRVHKYATIRWERSDKTWKQPPPWLRGRVRFGHWYPSAIEVATLCTDKTRSVRYEQLRLLPADASHRLGPCPKCESNFHG